MATGPAPRLLLALLLAGCASPRSGRLASDAAPASLPRDSAALEVNVGPMSPADAPSGGPVDAPMLPAERPPAGSPNGSRCESHDQCASGICIDRSCCSEVCPTCSRCDGPGGSCQLISFNTEDVSPPNLCTAGRVCDGTGTCRVSVGSACGAGDICMGQGCLNGFCCAQGLCQRPCESCARSAPGTCALFSNVRVPGCDGRSQICVGGRHRCGQVDQEVTGPAPSSAALGDDSFAQMFTVGRAGSLAAVRLRLRCADNATVTVQLHWGSASEPSGRVSTTGRARGADLRPAEPGVDDFAVLPFEIGAFVEPGERYAVAVRAEGGTCEIALSPAAGYPGGGLFIGPRSGAVWQPQSGALLFQTIVEQ
jgi:hypothetical protein